MFSRILIASDFAANAYAIIDALPGLKAFGTRECLLLGCITFYPFSALPEVPIQALPEPNLEEQKELLEKHGFAVTTRCVAGLPESVITRIADEENYSAIVVGAFSRSWAGEALLGGLASDIIHTATRPVLLIRLATREVGDASEVKAVTGDFGSILFPTDFSQNADYAFTYVKRLVEGGVRKVTLMHVQDKYRIEPFLLDRLQEFNRLDESRLLQMKENLINIRDDVEVDIRVVYGSPSIEIVNAIRDTKATLTVMGSQGRAYVSEVFLGSVSHSIARRSPTNVLLIPAKRE